MGLVRGKIRKLLTRKIREKVCRWIQDPLKISPDYESICVPCEETSHNLVDEMTRSILCGYQAARIIPTTPGFAPRVHK